MDPGLIRCLIAVAMLALGFVAGFVIGFSCGSGE
jgi:hypothetical protein